MLTFKKLTSQRLSKKDKESAILFGLVDLYIKTGKAISSNYLRESGFEFLSSATIRNYFSKLEDLGYLKQHHTSGGRIPTTKAYRKYANTCLNNSTKKTSSSDEKILITKLKKESKQITNYLHHAADVLSKLCNGCVFLMYPSFEQDFIQEVKLLLLEDFKLLCVVITDFGQIKPEIINLEKKIKDDELKLLEKFLLWRLSKAEKPLLSESLLKTAQKLYNEIMLRHVASFSSASSHENCYKTGLSNLLLYPEFQDPSILAHCLALFEDFSKIKTLLNETIKINQLTSWIGSELSAFGPYTKECSIITLPYRINQTPIGALAILVPKRTDYAKIFSLAQTFLEYISESLTKSIYKFKINFQNPIDPCGTQQASIMLEDKSKN